MADQVRTERERGRRHRLIVDTAREIAETAGWDAVTTRKLAERIEYSQPVLYTHFSGRDEIVTAVALEGFTELAAAVRAGVSPGAPPAEAVLALATSYLAFADRHPAVYDAMFTLSTGVAFADPATPAPPRDAFRAMSEALSEVAHGADPGVFTEVTWAALHGLATLTRSGRLPRDAQARRVELLVHQLVGPSGGRSAGGPAT